MQWKRTIKRIGVAAGIGIGLLILVVAIFLLSGMTIRLDFLRPAIEKGAAEAMGRPVTIGGSIELTPSLRPTVAVSDVTISNPPEWPETHFVSLALARTQIDIPDLLKKEISIGQITAQGIALNLVSDAKGRNNWTFSAPEGERQPEKPDAASTPAPANDQPRIRFTALDQLALTDITVRYHDEVMNKTVDFRIDDFSGAARKDEPVRFALNGSLQEHAYRFEVSGGSLASLRDKQTSWPLNITGNVAGTTVEATGELNRETEAPSLKLGFSLGKVDIGAILAKLKIADELEAATNRLSFAATLRGDSLDEWVRQSALHITLAGGQWILKDPNTQNRLPIQIVEGSIRVDPGQPFALHVNGAIDRTPVDFTIAGMPLADLISQPEAMTVHIGAEAAGATVTLDGRLAMPVRTRDASLAMVVKGESLEDLQALIRVNLPPFGPYRLEARLAVVNTGYELTNLHLKVGTSQLDGSFKLDMSGVKPRADARLTSKRLLLDDFSTVGWMQGEGGGDPQGAVPPPNKKADLATVKKTVDFLSPDVLGAFDATATVEVRQVLSGTDNLGGGLLGIAIQDGRFSLDPLRLDVPGGSVAVSFACRPTGNDATVHLGAHIDRFDVGVLVRRIDPDRKMGGLLNLDMALEGRAPDLHHMLANTSGHINFAFWPENLAAGIVDLWAVNLVTVLTETVDDEPNSMLNCMVARLALEDGLMQEEAIFMDTTRMSVRADATIDFKAGQIDVLAVPEAKRPEYFSLATPVKVQGTFSDFGIGVNKLSAAKTVVSFITSPITVTFRRLFSGNVPEDGKMACDAAWGQAPAAD